MSNVMPRLTTSLTAYLHGSCASHRTCAQVRRIALIVGLMVSILDVLFVNGALMLFLSKGEL